MDVPSSTRYIFVLVLTSLRNPQLPIFKESLDGLFECCIIFLSLRTSDLLLTSVSLPFQRNYFGSRHGKGEADGETGRLAQALARSVAAGESFQHAADMVAFGISQFPSTEFRK